MMYEKFLLKSKTVQGILMMSVPAVMQLLDIEWSDEQSAQLEAAITGVIGAIGGAWALYGRYATDGSKIVLRASQKPVEPNNE